MDILVNLAHGFETALSPGALLFCFIGVTVGMIVGALPGIGALAAISMVLPFTFYLDPTHALIMLAGIFYGTQYGNSITSILLNIPGTPSSAVTCLDGYPLARNGKAGVALFITTISSFIGGSLAIIILMVFAPVIANMAMKFGAAEYFSIMLLGLVAASSLSAGSALKGLAMVVAGIILGLVGMDVNTAQTRFTLGFYELVDGVSLVAIAMGMFGVAEILNNVNQGQSTMTTSSKITLRSLIPSRKEFRESLSPTWRGSVLGTLVGALPGAGPTIASFMAYALEKRWARDPSRFGRGAIEGIASPEAANNAAVQAGFIPTLSLGIPGDAVMAIMLGAMIIHGIAPGPQFLVEQSAVFWGLVASFWIGNVLLLILNIPLITVWVRILTIPYYVLYPAMLFFIAIGVYSIRNSVFDVYTLIIFGGVGYFLMRFGYPAAPLLLGFVLGPIMEQNFKRALVLSNGDMMVFIQRPISAVFIICIVALLILMLVTSTKWFRLWRAGRLGDEASTG